MSMFASNTKSLDPYDCFGIYMGLQFVFFLSAYFMNKSLEPGEIKAYKELQNKKENDENQDDENTSLI